MVLLTKKINTNIKRKTKIGDRMKCFLRKRSFSILFLLLLSSSELFSLTKNQYYDFIDPVMINLSSTDPLYHFFNEKSSQKRKKQIELWKKILQNSNPKNSKAIGYVVEALMGEKTLLDAFNEIRLLAPNSVWFNLLSYMILEDLQYKRHAIMAHQGKKDTLFEKKIRAYKKEKKRFLKLIEKSKKRDFFTLYAKLYLNVLEFNSLKHSELKSLRKLANHKQKPYIKLLSYIYGLHQLPSSSLQERLILNVKLQSLLKAFSAQKQLEIIKYTRLQLSMLNENGSIEKSLNQLFSQHKINRQDIFKALNYVDASKFKYYIEREKKTFLEKELFKKTMKKLYKGDVAKILATLYLRENNFFEAQFYLRQVPQKNLFIPYNPFNATFIPSNKIKSKRGYSQRRFIETMLRIEDALKKKPNSAQDHFLYATALYNKSWFGNFPLSSVLYHTPNLIKGKKLPITTNLTQSQKEYELALKYAKDEEFKAKITYQLLKIKYNQAISDTYKYDKDMWVIPHLTSEGKTINKIIKLLKASKDFKEALYDFKAEYQHTRYAKEAIKRWIIFKYF